MLNRVTIMGRIGNDIELRQTQSGVSVTTFNLACDRDYKGQDGNRETDWVPVVAWRDEAEFVAKNFSKGRAIVVDGRLQVRSYEKNGERRTITEIVAEHFYFCDSKQKTGNNAAPMQEIEEEDGDVPF